MQLMCLIKLDPDVSITNLPFHIATSQNDATAAMVTAAVAMVTVAAVERSRLQSALIHDDVMSRLQRLPWQQYSHVLST